MRDGGGRPPSPLSAASRPNGPRRRRGEGSCFRDAHEPPAYPSLKSSATTVSKPARQDFPEIFPKTKPRKEKVTSLILTGRESIGEAVWMPRTARSIELQGKRCHAREKVSGTVALLLGPSGGMKCPLQAEAPRHLIRPRRLPERAATPDGVTKDRQLGLRLRGIHQRHPAPGTLQRPSRQPGSAAGR